VETKEAHGEPAWLDAGYAGMERMITSLVIMLPMTVYGFYTVISEHLVTGWNWLWAFLYLVVPLLALHHPQHRHGLPHIYRQCLTEAFGKITKYDCVIALLCKWLARQH
jgi:hypothetical protein